MSDYVDTFPESSAESLLMLWVAGVGFLIVCIILEPPFLWWGLLTIGIYALVFYWGIRGWTRFFDGRTFTDCLKHRNRPRFGRPQDIIVPKPSPEFMKEYEAAKQKAIKDSIIRDMKP